MKVKDLHIHSTDNAYLLNLAEDYWFLGWDAELEEGHLTVFALPRAENRWALGYAKGKKPKAVDLESLNE